MAIWFAQPELTELASRGSSTMIEHIGIEMLDIGDDYLKARMPVDHRTIQPGRILHGGASVAFAEAQREVELAVRELYDAWTVRDPERMRQSFTTTEGLAVWGTDAWEKIYGRTEADRDFAPRSRILAALRVDREPLEILPALQPCADAQARGAGVTVDEDAGAGHEGQFAPIPRGRRAAG